MLYEVQRTIAATLQLLGYQDIIIMHKINLNVLTILGIGNFASWME